MASSQADTVCKWEILIKYKNTFLTCGPNSASWLQTRAAKTIFRGAPGLGAQIVQGHLTILDLHERGRYYQQGKVFHRATILKNTV